MSISHRIQRLRDRRRRSTQVRLGLEQMEDRTVPAQAIPVGPNLSLSAFGPNSGAHVGDSLYFLGHQSTDAPGVSEIWQVNGSATATEVSVPALAGMSIGEIANVNGSLFVTAATPLSSSTPPTSAPAVNLWKIDSSAPGGATELTSFTTPGAAYLQPLGNKVVFEYTPLTEAFPAAGGGSSLWVSDGTAAGTMQLTSFPEGSFIGLSNAPVGGGDLYFTVAGTLPAAPVLWATDGTAAGTAAVSGMAAAPSGFTASYDLTAAGDSVYAITGTGTEVQLWKATNGAATLVKSIDNSAGVLPGPVVAGPANGQVYFAVNQASGDQVWTTDGTTTTLVSQLPPSAASNSSTVDSMAVVNGAPYFSVGTPGALMTPDGKGGAVSLPLPAGVAGVWAVNAVNGRLYFMADDGVHGNELWSTDGTANGAVRLTDINPGSGSSDPLGPESAGGALYVAASGGLPSDSTTWTGEQLWKLPDASTPAGAAATTTLSPSATTVGIGGQVTLTATVTAANPGQPAPTGQVVFRDGDVIYGSAPLVNGTATLAATIVVTGPHAIQAVYTGDGTFDESISSNVTVTAGRAATTVALTSSDAAASPGESVNFTATVSTAVNVPTLPGGSVSFFDGSKFLGTGFLNGGVASYQTSSLSAGQHSITAVYGGDANYSPGSSAALAQSVGAKITVGLTANKTNTNLGQAIMLSAHVATADGSSLPAGSTVIFRDAATPLGSVTVDGNGNATLTVSTLGVGSHSLSAALFNGGAEFDSPAVAVNVKVASTTMALRSTDQTAIVGEILTLTATISTPGSGGPAATGTVTFTDGGKTLGTASVANGRAALRLANLALGMHPITANYAGDTNYTGSSASLTQTVTPATVATKITAGASDTTAVVGEQISLTADVTPMAGTAKPIGSVLFMDGKTQLGAVKIDPNGHALLLTSSLGMGNHSITASFGGAGIFTGSISTPINVTVRLGTTAKLTASSGTISAGQAVTLSATINPAKRGGVQPSGGVTFYDGTKALGTASVQNGVATFTTSALTTTGVHRVTAVYAGSSLFNSAGTNTVYLNVRASSTTTTLLPPALPAAGTGIVTLVANVAGTGSPTGKVTFSDGNTTLGTAVVTNGKATLQVPRLTAGSHYLRAVFNGIGIYGGSSSSVVHYTIQGATSTTLLATPAAFGQTTNLKATVAVLSPGLGKANGDVRFMDGTTVLGTVHVHDGVASLGVKLATGLHHLTAVYLGTSDFATSKTGAMSYSVSKAAPSLSLRATPTTPKAGNNVTVHLDLGPATPGAAGPTGAVLLSDGAAIIGSITLGHGAIEWHTTKLAKGPHTLKVTYAGDGNYLAASTTVTLTIA
jgi:ELWxxDGT repeat protein